MNHRRGVLHILPSKVDGEIIVSVEINSLAYDEALKELHQQPFEPDLRVIVNAHYLKTPTCPMASEADVIQVRGRITVSF